MRRTLRTTGIVVGVSWRLAVGVASIIYLGVVLLPLSSITGREMAPLLPAWGGLRVVALRLESALEPFQAHPKGATWSPGRDVTFHVHVRHVLCMCRQ